VGIVLYTVLYYSVYGIIVYGVIWCSSLECVCYYRVWH